MTELGKYNVDHPFILHILCMFPKDNPLIKKKEFVKVEGVYGKQQDVRCIKEHEQVRMFGKEWPAFVKEKKLKMGDVCIFELIRTDDPTFRVTVLQSEEEA